MSPFGALRESEELWSDSGRLTFHGDFTFTARSAFYQLRWQLVPYPCLPRPGYSDPCNVHFQTELLGAIPESDPESTADAECGSVPDDCRLCAFSLWSANCTGCLLSFGSISRYLF